MSRVAEVEHTMHDLAAEMNDISTLNPSARDFGASIQNVRLDGWSEPDIYPVVTAVDDHNLNNQCV